MPYADKDKQREFEKKRRSNPIRKAWRRKYDVEYRTRDSRKNAHLKSMYGITLEQFNQMLTSQDNKCGICEEPFKDRKRTHVDHNHKTGRIRQLLCQECNHALGLFKENKRILLKAVEYLNRWDE